MDEEERRHFEVLLRNHRQRLRALELKAATFGTNTAPELLTEIDDLSKTVMTLERQLGALAKLDAVPPAVPDFVGRAEELRWIEETIGQAVAREAPAVIGIRGLGGLGKTQLALLASDRLGALFPDGQFLLRMRGTGQQPLSPAQALQVIIHAHYPDVVSEDVAELQSRYQSVLAGKRVLILADDARDVTQVKPLQPPPGCALLITSRSRFTIPGFQPLDLELLPEDEAAQLVLAICPRIGEHARRLAELCGHLPIALRVSAALLANDDTRNVERYLARLEDERERLTQLRDPDDPDLDVEASLQLSYDALPPDAQRVLCDLSVFRVTFDLPGAAAVAQLDEAQAEEVLGLLRRQNLIAWDPVLERYAMQELVRVFAAARQAEEDRAAARRRHTEYYLRMAERAEAELSGTEPKAWLDQLQRNINNLRTALERSLGGEDLELGIRLSGALWLFWEMRGYLSEGRRWLEQALAAEGTTPPAVRAKAASGAGVLALRQGDYAAATALLEEGLALYRSAGDTGGAAGALSHLGWVMLDQSDYARAQLLFEESLGLYRKLEDQRGIASALTSLGWIAPLQQQNYQLAAQFFEESMAIYREVGDQNGIAGSLVNLAWVALADGDMSQATAHCSASLQLYRDIEDREGITECLLAMADVAGAWGQTERAVRLWAAAEALYSAIGAVLSLADDTDYKRNMALVRERLDEGAFAAAWHAGQRMALEEVIAEALQVAAPDVMDAPRALGS